jgi:preprotein translocase subunit SecG
MLPILINLLLGIHILVSLLIILIVLMQRPKSEGLGAAFGGGMTENIFGAQTTNVLAKATRWLGGIFFLLTLLLSMLYARQSSARSTSAIHQQLLAAPKPAAIATPSPGESPSPSATPLPPSAPATPIATPDASPAGSAPVRAEVGSETSTTASDSSATSRAPKATMSASPRKKPSRH